MPQHSAILPAYGSKSIHANHMDMTKFEFADDPGYSDVSTTLWRWKKDLSTETKNASAMSQVAQGQALLPGIGAQRSKGETTVHSINSFHGQNDTRGGKVFQGSIDVRGDVHIG